MEAILESRMSPPRPVSPFAQAVGATKVQRSLQAATGIAGRSVEAGPEVIDPVYRGSSRSFSGLPIPQRSQLTPSQRMKQRQVEAKRESEGRKAYVTYVVG